MGTLTQPSAGMAALGHHTSYFKKILLLLQEGISMRWIPTGCPPKQHWREGHQWPRASLTATSKPMLAHTQRQSRYVLSLYCHHERSFMCTYQESIAVCMQD